MKAKKTFIHFFPVKKDSFLILYADKEATDKEATGEDMDDYRYKSFFVEHQSELAHLSISLIDGEPSSVICSKE